MPLRAARSAAWNGTSRVQLSLVDRVRGRKPYDAGERDLPRARPRSSASVTASAHRSARQRGVDLLRLLQVIDHVQAPDDRVGLPVEVLDPVQRHDLSRARPARSRPSRSARARRSRNPPAPPRAFRRISPWIRSSSDATARATAAGAAPSTAGSAGIGSPGGRRPGQQAPVARPSPGPVRLDQVVDDFLDRPLAGQGARAQPVGAETGSRNDLERAANAVGDPLPDRRTRTASVPLVLEVVAGLRLRLRRRPPGSW